MTWRLRYKREGKKRQEVTPNVSFPSLTLLDVKRQETPGASATRDLQTLIGLYPGGSRLL